MPTYKFEAIKHLAFKSVPCTECGNKIKRQQTFFQTHNPFNKNTEGRIKSRTEIQRELVIKADDWKNEPETHEKCKKEADNG